MSTSLILKPDKNYEPCCLSQKFELNQETQFSPFFLKLLQHGFRRGRSCETQLIEFIDDLTSDLEEGQQTDILITDFAKAFDKVHHSLLIHKLHQHGIRGEVNNWIKNWLLDRRQAVAVEGEKSEPVTVDSGIPKALSLAQGYSCTTSTTFPQGFGQRYAYLQMTLLPTLLSSCQRIQRLQEDLNELATWEDRWHMQFHVNTCVVLTVSGKKVPFQADYKLHGQTLARVKSAKYLGVTLTEDLKWDQHISNICDKANWTIGFLRRNLNISATSIKERAFFTLVRPLVEYASIVWDPYTQINVQKLEMVQRRAARYVKNRHGNTSSVSDN